MIFVMPFLFVYTPLLLNGTTMEITITAIACFIGVVAWAGFLEGYLLKQALPLEKISLGIAAACLLMPVAELISFIFSFESEYQIQVYAAGAILLIATLIFQKVRQPVEVTVPGE